MLLMLVGKVNDCPLIKFTSPNLRVSIYGRDTILWARLSKSDVDHNMKIWRIRDVRVRIVGKISNVVDKKKNNICSTKHRGDCS